MTFVTPNLREHSFSCPHCKSFAPQDKFFMNASEEFGSKNYIPSQYLELKVTSKKTINDYYNYLLKLLPPANYSKNEIKGIVNQSSILTICTVCSKHGFWSYSLVDEAFQLKYPTPDVVDPEENMPEDVKELYEEASACFPYSKKASSALLRIAIELYLKTHMGLNEKSLNKMIGQLKNDSRIPDYLHQGLDILRYYGNEGAHPGTINLNDKENEVLFLFKLINQIISVTITEPENIKDLYSDLPPNYLESIQKRDSNN